jgi:integrase/recombinase XerD
MRTSELCDLAIADVDLAEQTVTIVRGKGGKSRVLPIGQYASHYVGLYVEKARKYMRRGSGDDPGYLFLSRRGNPFDRSSINKTVMRTIAKNSGVDRRISCYSFRRAVASHLLGNGVDVTYIARLLGHRSLRTTQRYLSVEIGDLKRMHAMHHPRERRAASGT